MIIVWMDGGTGPLIYNLSQREMRPHSVSLHSSDEWKNKTGNYTISLNRPVDSNVHFIVMVK